MQNKLTLNEYRERINEIARAVIDEHEYSGRPIVELVDSFVDGDKFVIYPKYHYRILEFSEHDAYAYEMHGVSHFDEWSNMMQHAVYYAICEDVRKRVHELRDE